MDRLPRRVLHVTAPARYGGLERVVTMLAVGQMRRGMDVRIAAVLSPADQAAHPFVDGAQSVGIPVDIVVVGGRDYLEEYRALCRLVVRYKPDVLHTHGYRSDVVGGLVARRSGVTFVSTAHGLIGGRLRNRLNESVQRFALRWASAVIAVSRPLANRLAASGIPQERIHVVQNAFSPSTATLPRDQARGRLGVTTGFPVIGWVGRLSAEKGADVMVDALSATESNWQLSMIGEGPERHAVQLRADALGVNDRIRWHGPIADAGSLLRAFDVFVLSSRTEGTPIALFEAMHACVPVIATNVGGVPHVASENEALIVPPENPSAIARALAEVLREPSEAMRRAQRALKRLESEFGADPWLDRVEDVYRMAARARGRLEQSSPDPESQSSE